MRRRTSLFALLVLIGATAISLAGQAADGRIEINQASVEAAGGFPYTISEPGSYVLTSSLTVPADTSGIVIESDHVTLDLNGFTVVGPFTCQQGDCDDQSNINGITANTPPPGPTMQNNSTIRNGTVYGFRARCVQVGFWSRVENLQVHDCGQSGIQTGGECLVMSNLVFNVGWGGIAAQAGCVIAHNTVSRVNLGGGSNVAISGGKQTAGNNCDDGSCEYVDNRRRFYMTQDAHDGSEALLACANGFHMASLWEILDVSQLKYDVNLGETTEDSGFGPPSTARAWIRTGKPNNTGSASPGGASCMGYSSTMGNGTTVGLFRDWEVGFAGSEDSRAPWWSGASSPCSLTNRVWCVED